LAAGGHHDKTRAELEEAVHEVGGWLHDVLAVVQQKQRPLVGDGGR
jgi:hypothetical protein